MIDPSLFLLNLTLFVLAIFLGVELINKVPATLHTPLMSGANAVSGISVIGALFGTNRDARWRTLGRQPARRARAHAGHGQRRGRVRGDPPHAQYV